MRSLDDATQEEWDELRRQNMKTKKPHPHAAFIAEALTDLNRKIEESAPGYYWKNSSLEIVLGDTHGKYRFRFADTVEQKLKIVSSLRDNEILAAYYSNPKKDTCLRYLVNAAAQQAIEDLKDPPLKWLEDMWSTRDIHIAQVAIQEYIRNVKKGKL